MDADEIARLWAHNKHRPAFVREHADEIEQHTEIDEAIPDSTLPEVARWCERHAETVDEQLPAPGETADDNGVIQ